MNDELREKTEQWMQLERKTLEQRKLADQFYDANMMKLIEEDFIDRNGNKVYETVDNLVISVGTSYEPIVLNISLLLPGRILFIYTEKSEETLDKVIEYCNLKAAEYDKQKVNEIDPIDIYSVTRYNKAGVHEMGTSGENVYRFYRRYQSNVRGSSSCRSYDKCADGLCCIR